MKWLQCIVAAFLIIISARVTVSFEPTGIKNATLAETGEGVIFEWFQKEAMNKSHAKEFCDSLRSDLPNVRELRYFYKSLNLETNSIFYLEDIIETTTDSPRDDIGERLCITIINSPGNPLQLGETNATVSCSTKTNSIVCKRINSPIDSTPYSKCLETYFRENKGEDIITMGRTTFFTILGSICLVLMITNFLWIIFCYKYCSEKNKQKTNAKAKTPSLFAGNGFMKPLSLGPNGSELGRYDLLSDIPLQRESYRKSHREQKLANSSNIDSTEALTVDPKETDATGFL